jgi:hypothetical protein
MRTVRAKPATEQAELAALGLAGHVIDILHEEGIHCLADWRQLGRRRRNSIFGLPPTRVRQLDKLAGGALG